MGPRPDTRSSSRAERGFELLVDSVRDYAIFMLDPEGRVASWNTGAQLIKGYAPVEIIGKPIHEFYPPEARAAGRPEQLLAIAREHGRIEEEGWRVRKDGSQFWADVVISAMRDDSGELVGYVKVTRDLTERRRAEEERRHQEERFRRLVESARDYAIFMLDPAGRVASWNEGAARIKGYSAAEIIGRHFTEFYPDDDVRSGKGDRELEAALRDGRFEDEGWRLRKGGVPFWANVVITPLRDSAGRHIGFSKITRDLTERRAAELDRLELAHAHEALRLRDEFLSIASHELRTPLMALQLQLDSLAASAGKLDAKQASKLARAERNVQRLVELIGTLLDVSRISRGKLSLAPRTIDLGETITEVADRLHDSLQAARCTMTLDLPSGIVGTWDPLRVGQVIGNLIANAARYAAGTAVDISLVRDDDHAIARVEDRGPGIPAHLLERVFERFERAASARNYGGLGLGLYVSRQIVEGHGGTIRASRREGGGTTVELRLPIRNTSAEPAAAGRELP